MNTRTTTIELTSFDLSFLTGYYYAKCFAKERELRKYAMINYGKLYRLLSDNERADFEGAKASIHKMVDTPELLTDVNSALEDLQNNLDGIDENDLP